MGSVQGLQESRQWEEEAHTDSAFNLLDPTSAANTTDTQGLGVAWRGPHRGSVSNKSAMGGQSGRKDRNSDLPAHLPLPSAIASSVGTSLDHVQDLGQPLPFPLVEAEQALVPINSPASRLVGHAQNLELEHLEPTEATREGEGD